MSWAAAAQFAGPIIGGMIGAKGARDANKANLQMSREARAHQEHLLKNQIQWRMEDARAAGVSPSVALGGSVVGSGTSAPIPMQNELHAMGQGVARSLTSGATAYQRKQQALNLENMALQNEQLKAQIAGSKLAVARQAGMPKPFPSHLPTNEVTSDHVSGRAPIHDPLIGTIEAALAAAPKIVRSEVVGSRQDNALIEAGHHPNAALMRVSGGYMVVPSKTGKERTEDDVWLQTALKADILANPKAYEPKEYPGKGKEWVFYPATFTFKRRNKVTRRQRWFGNDKWNLGMVWRD